MHKPNIANSEKIAVPVIETKNLCCIYGQGTPYETIAINNINFCLEENSITGIIGQTGSGKSTLARVMNGLLKPSSGNIMFRGKDIWKDIKEIKQIHFKVGLVFQYPEHQLFGETVFDDIAFGPQNQGLNKDKIKEQVYIAANFTGLNIDLLNKSPFELSGGEKRRAAIAGIIAMDPDVLILDEPTAGLDPSGTEDLLGAILGYHVRRKNSIVFISHTMQDIAKICDNVIAMDKGNIILSGSPGDVFSKDIELQKVGLNIPQITRIMHGIAAKGYNVRRNVVTVSEGEKEIIRLLNIRR